MNRAVARATGDDVGVITHRGFSLVDSESPVRDADLDALIADWEQIERESRASFFERLDTTRPLSSTSFASGVGSTLRRNLRPGKIGRKRRLPAVTAR